MTIFPQQLSGYVAELASAFICADLGISPRPRDDHASHIGHRLRVMKADKELRQTVTAEQRWGSPVYLGRFERRGSGSGLPPEDVKGSTIHGEWMPQRLAFLLALRRFKWVV